MAYSESTVGGSSGGQFRVWINSIRTENGSAAENYERWRAEGGIKRISGTGRIWNLYNAASYNVQLGLNGVNKSGNFSYDFPSGGGGSYAWGTGTTTVYRDSAGNGRGFTSRMDINMSNSPYLTSGWVQSSDSIQTKLRHADLTKLSMDAGGVPATDEGPLWLEFSNPAGTNVRAFIEAPPGGSNRLITTSNVGSRYNFPNLNGGSLSVALQQAYPNSATGTMRIGIYDTIDGTHYDYRDRTYTIKNDQGQAAPIFSDFDYLDTNAATVAVTGSDQVLVQGLSTLQASVLAADAATTQKYANRGNYAFTIGGYSQSVTWPASGDVVHDIGAVNDVTGDQTLSVRAIDARGYGTTVSKNVTILPYSNPGYFVGLAVSYVNDFDRGDGLKVDLINDTTIGAISPLTLGGVDKNAVTPTTGLRFDMAYGNNGYTGSWTNIAFTQEAGTGLVNVTQATLEAQILAKMNSIGSSLALTESQYNSERWYVIFEMTDKFSSQYYTSVIDVGTPFFRIGANGRLYYKELEFFDTFTGNPNQWVPGVAGVPIQGSWIRKPVPASTVAGAVSPAGAMTTGHAVYENTQSGNGTNADWINWKVHLSAGLYQVFVYYQAHVNAPYVVAYIHDNNEIYGASNNYFYVGERDMKKATAAGANVTGNTEAVWQLTWQGGPNIPVGDGHTYGIELDTVNADARTQHIMRVTAIEFRKVG